MLSRRPGYGPLLALAGLLLAAASAPAEPWQSLFDGKKLDGWKVVESFDFGRHGKVEDIGNAVRFLCGPESSWITGVVLSVDGGHHLRRGPDVGPFSRMLYGDDITEGRIVD